MPVTDVDLPDRITVDRDSRYALYGARYGNVFCGVMSLPEGVIYVAPYTHAPDRPAWTPESVGGLTEYSHHSKCAGQDIRRIYHQEGGIAGHEQMTIFLANAGIHPAAGFVGFSILFHPEKGGFGATSRSQNNQHFRDWAHRGQDRAFQQYHATAQATTPDVQGPPTFHDVTSPSSGSLPPTWAAAIQLCLQRALGKDYVSCTQVRITSAAVGGAAPPPPPPPL